MYIHIYIASWELTYPLKKAVLKMIFLFPRWDTIVSWRVIMDPKKNHLMNRSSSAWSVLRSFRAFAVSRYLPKTL